MMFSCIPLPLHAQPLGGKSMFSLDGLSIERNNIAPKQRQEQRSWVWMSLHSFCTYIISERIQEVQVQESETHADRYQHTQGFTVRSHTGTLINTLALKENAERIRSKLWWYTISNTDTILLSC